MVTIMVVMVILIIIMEIYIKVMEVTDFMVIIMEI